MVKTFDCSVCLGPVVIEYQSRLKGICQECLENALQVEQQAFVVLDRETALMIQLHTETEVLELEYQSGGHVADHLVEDSSEIVNADPSIQFAIAGDVAAIWNKQQ